MDDIVKKFWDNIEKTKYCWNWVGSLDKSKYPIIRATIDGKFTEFYPRRISMEIANKYKASRKHILPSCKNKLCVNPEHLVQGNEARFWAKVQKIENECWIWTAAHDKNMYGKFRIVEDGIKIDTRAHRYSWQLFTGRKVPNGLEVCHKCDKPYCVNPYHLFLGTTKDNAEDRNLKNRQVQGEKVHTSKLKIDDVKQIRELFKSGKYSKTQLSKMFKIRISTLSDLVMYKTWKSVE